MRFLHCAVYFLPNEYGKIVVLTLFIRRIKVGAALVL